MKNFRSKTLLAAALLAMAACTTDPAENETAPQPQRIAVAFGAEQVSDSSRATITPGDNAFTMQWTDSDLLGIAAVAPGATTGELSPFDYDRPRTVSPARSLRQPWARGATRPSIPT